MICAVASKAESIGGGLLGLSTVGGDLKYIRSMKKDSFGARGCPEGVWS